MYMLKVLAYEDTKENIIFIACFTKRKMLI